jgi:hypothetical protein
LEEHDDNCTEEEIRIFQEKFKKQLNRATTNTEILTTYLHYLFSIEKFKEAGYFRPQCTSDGILEPETVKMMKKISKELTEKYEL